MEQHKTHIIAWCVILQLVKPSLVISLDGAVVIDTHTKEEIRGYTQRLHSPVRHRVHEILWLVMLPQIDIHIGRVRILWLYDNIYSKS